MLFIPSKPNISSPNDISNLKKFNRIIIIYPIYNSPGHNWGFIIFNSSIRSGRGPFIANNDFISSIYTYYGVIYNPIKYIDGKKLLNYESVLEIKNFSSSDILGDAGDINNFKYHDYHSSYLELLLGEPTIAKSNNIIRLPDPKFYTDEHQYLVTGDSIDFEDDYQNENKLITLAEYLDDKTKIFLMDDYINTNIHEDIRTAIFEFIGAIHFRCSHSRYYSLTMIYDNDQGFNITGLQLYKGDEFKLNNDKLIRHDINMIHEELDYFHETSRDDILYRFDQLRIYIHYTPIKVFVRVLEDKRKPNEHSDFGVKLHNAALDNIMCYPKY